MAGFVGSLAFLPYIVVRIILVAFLSLTNETCEDLPVTVVNERRLLVTYWLIIIILILNTIRIVAITYPCPTNAPFAYILIGGILRNMDANLEEAATILKASRAKIMGRITLPIVLFLRERLVSLLLGAFLFVLAHH